VIQLTGNLKKFNAPEFILEWVEAKILPYPEKDKKNKRDSYTLRASKKGLEVLDGLRDIRGQLPLLEEIGKKRERFFKEAKSFSF